MLLGVCVPRVLLLPGWPPGGRGDRETGRRSIAHDCADAGVRGRVDVPGTGRVDALVRGRVDVPGTGRVDELTNPSI